MKPLGILDIEKIVELPDGSAEIYFHIPKDLKKKLIKYYGWSRWSNKKFGDVIRNALLKATDKDTNNDSANER